ncbi:sulfite exporter TauE/SafE family protein [Rhabdothermincola sp. EGI L10124]|nr:sulfite exporter TauE/SafE family protein [Rhabdothermincola salaria]
MLLAGAAVGVLGGLIGLGGAEFRLPLLIGAFGFAALHAVILNKAMSLVVVAAALPVRLFAVPLADMAAHWDVAVNLLAGSLIGAWLGAGWATRLRSDVLYRVLAVLLVGIAVVLFASHQGDMGSLGLDGLLLVVVGVAAGVGIGVVASVMGVAGGELLIPTIVLLYGLDIKLAGSMSLAVSLPTMVVAFSRYSQDTSFAILGEHRRFVVMMAAGSLAGSVLGGVLVGVVPGALLIPALSMILLVSAVKVWRHQT